MNLRIPQSTVLVLLVLCYSCSQQTESIGKEEFDLANSDPAAVELADSIMVAMGGKSNWDKSLYLSWNQSGGRKVKWDRKSNRVRLEDLNDSIIYLLDLDEPINDRVSVKGREILNDDSLEVLLIRGRSTWVKDSYSLLMPFLLKDRGATLVYEGEMKTKAGELCNVIRVTFTNAREKTNDMYLIFAGLKDNLVKQWMLIDIQSSDTVFIHPWDHYRRYKDILLSVGRSEGEGPKEVTIETNIPEKSFTGF